VRSRLDAAAGWLVPRSPLLLTLLVATIGFWPGHMNADTLIQISEVSGETPITDQHAPILLFLWKLGWPLGVRPGAVLVIQVAVFLIGSYLVLRVALSPLGASIAAALVALSPPVLGQLGLLGRDTWFACLLVLTFGLLAVAARSAGRTTTWALRLAALAAFLALATRQNAAAAVAIAGIAGAFLLLGPRLRDRGRFIRLGAPIAAGVAVTIAAVGVQVGVVRLAGTETVHPDQGVYIYDLAAFSRREHTSLFPGSVYPLGDVRPIERHSSLYDIIDLVAGRHAIFKTPLSGAQTEDMREAWLDEVESHPLEWLDIHWDSWVRQVGLTGGGVLVVYHPGIDTNRLGYEIEFDDENRVLIDYLGAFTTDGPSNSSLLIFRPFVYLLIAAVAAVWLLRRGGAAPIVGGLAVSALTYQIGYLLATVAIQYRFEYPAVVAGLLAGVVAVGLMVRELVARRQGVAITGRNSARAER
jgi:hypothetical protein